MSGQTSSVAILGAGELGSALGRAFAGGGVRVSVWARPESAEAARLRLPDLDLVDELDAAVAGAGLVVAAVPGSAQPEVLALAVPHLERRSVYVDPSPRLPEEKLADERALAALDVDYADAAVLGTVAAATMPPIWASGTGAAALCRAVAPAGIAVRVLSERAGDASRLKLLRSVYLKGRDAVIVEATLAAWRHGLLDELLESIGGPAEQVPFDELAARLVCGVAVHASRRAEELADATRLLESVDLEPLVSAAAVERLDELGRLGLRARFEGVRPSGLEEALAAIDAALAQDAAEPLPAVAADARITSSTGTATSVAPAASATR